MSRLLTALALAAALPLFAAEPNSTPADPSASKPNILLIVADDLGWGDVSWHDGKFFTPNLDNLRKGGVELDRHYVQPVCTPTRAALLSGRWTSRFGPQALSPSNLRVFMPGSPTLASVLKECGYSTFLTGKWHLGSRPEWGPQHYGFEHSYGFLTGAVDPWEHTYRKGPYMKCWHRDGVLLDEKGNATELLAQQGCAWIREAAKTQPAKPWFLYVPFGAVHIPVDAPDEYKALYKDVNFPGDDARTESFRRYGGFVSEMDAKVGDLIRALEETGQRANTLVIFTSDNGAHHETGNPYVGTTPPLKVNVSSNKPLRGFKNELHEGGIRVPALVNWPGTLKPGKVSAPIHAADWFPTLTKLAGWTPPQSLKLDGIDQWSVLNGANAGPRTIYIPHLSGAAVLQGDWKLIAYNDKKAAELYNIVTDPLETTDLAAQEPNRVKELQSVLAGLRKDDVTTLPADLQGLEKGMGKADKRQQAPASVLEADRALARLDP